MGGGGVYHFIATHFKRRWHFLCLLPLPECAAVIDEARQLTFRSKDIMLQVQEAIKEAQHMRNLAHNIIENSLQGKREETLGHKVTGDFIP